jgi:hypothetical protein
VRYRQLHALHEQLRREFSPATIPTFPPKKILPLTIGQVRKVAVTPTRGRCYDHNFLRFLPFFGKKLEFF